jgi:hypothetical protein
MNEPALKWLLVEGLIPILGASCLYMFLGGCRWVAAADKKKFEFDGLRALDPLGWLYGAVIISVQSGLRSFTITGAGFLSIGCFVGAGMCFLLLVAAMNEASAAQGWKPPISLQIGAGLLVGAILFAGFSAHGLLQGTETP